MQSQLEALVDAIDRRGITEPAPELERYAKEETLHQKTGHERRRFRRYSLITNVIVVPLDKALRPAGDPFVALSSGMSVDGIRLIHADPSPSEHLFIEIEWQPVRFVLSVLRSRPLGPCFEIAGRLMNATVVNREMESPTVTTARCKAIGRASADTTALDRFPPAVNELAHWAGVTAAVQLLNSNLSGKPRHA